MALEKYKQKRDFRSTSEPKGRSALKKQDLIFVVQKHDATRLHYDLRLELNGVLKSWAVPKGPSMNPADKRLAVKVEDHPFDYKDFEGNIPKGNYGAGNVIVWDQGIYHAVNLSETEKEEKKLNAGLNKGHISFILQGKKLKGEFSLVKIKDSKEDSWLLIKKEDTYASDKDILEKKRSVISSETIESLGKKSGKKKKEQGSKAGKHSVEEGMTAEGPEKPAFIKPMLAETTTRPFNDKNWVFEIKFDGYRTIAVIDKKSVDLYSRNHLSFNDKFEPVRKELKKLEHKAVLDGEVVVEDKNGRSDFQLLQNYQKTGKGNIKYYVFDLLNLEGNNTRGLSLLERKELLKLLLGSSLNNVFYSDHITGDGIGFFELAGKNKFEGIMAKDAASPYRSGARSHEWLKIKITQEEEAIIVGFTRPKGSRKYFGAILLGQWEDNELKYIGNCGTGFSEETLKELHKKLSPLAAETASVNGRIITNEKITWTKPKLVCQVRFTERTNDGSLRHPVYLGLRTDKKAKEVTIPQLVEDHNTTKKKTNSMEKNDTISEVPEINSGKKDFDLVIGKVKLHLTNQNKIFFPDDGVTKGDVVNYYSEVADIILPYLKNRPQSMNRFPNGIKGPSFYQKDLDTDKIPSWLKTSRIYSDSNKDYIDYLLCNDKSTLIYMANLGCIELNPWSSTIKTLDNPDWMVIDLDPDKVDFRKVAETAQMVRKFLESLEIESYCKTSGSRGLHIYVPLSARYEYETVRLFAKYIAHGVHQQLPEITSVERQVQKRHNMIYLDYLQNNRGQTLAAPYSVRPKPGATVSSPLEWSEVNKSLSPSQFTIRNMLKRIEQKGDLWKPVLGKGVNLNKILKKISAE